MRHDYRVRRLLAVVGVAIALSFAAPRLLTHTPYPRLGVSLGLDAERGLQRVDRVIGPPAQGLLKPGDLLISVDGDPMPPPRLRPSAPRAPLPREAFTLEFERDGKRLYTLFPPVNLTAWQRMRVLLLPLAAVVAAPLVAFVLVWRRPDLGTAWVFLLFANVQAIAVVHEIYRNPESEPTGWLRYYLSLYGWLVCWAPATFIHFMAVFPRPRWRAGEVWRSKWAWLVAAGHIVPLYFVGQIISKGSLSLPQFSWFQTIATGVGVFSLVERYGRRGHDDWHPSRSQRGLALLVALLLLLGAAISWAFENEAFSTLLRFPFYRVALTVVSIGVLVTPFIMAFLIARDPVFDPRRLLEKGLPYAVLSGLVATLYVAIVLAGLRLFAAITGEQELYIHVAAAVVVASVFAPLRGWLQRGLGRLFRRDPMALRAALDQAGHELLQALDRDDARAAVEAALTRGLGRQVALEWPESGPPRLAAGEELPEHAVGAVDNLLTQAGLRLENLALAEQRAAAERRSVELREAAMRAELRALHSQVQPHFLFNALNALSYLTETDPRAAQRFTERLADMLRYTVEAGSRSAALLADEIAFVEDYLGVARERYEGDLAFAYRGPRELLSATVPPLLLQPLVENSLKHGLAPGARGLCLTLDAERADGWLTVTFKDDGMSGGNGGRGLGVGLENLEQRVRHFAGEQASMQAGPRVGGGFAVTLRWREGAEVRR